MQAVHSHSILKSSDIDLQLEFYFHCSWYRLFEKCSHYRSSRRDYMLFRLPQDSTLLYRCISNCRLAVYSYFDHRLTQQTPR